uniref:Uncharacterized protein n=1 Tax=Oryza glumipatula TaxID=40148 RepID=A0A0D9ZS37_9ORYZ
MLAGCTRPARPCPVAWRRATPPPPALQELHHRCRRAGRAHPDGAAIAEQAAHALGAAANAAKPRTLRAQASVDTAHHAAHREKR